MSKKIRQPFEIPYDNILDITKDKVSKHRGKPLIKRRKTYLGTNLTNEFKKCYIACQSILEEKASSKELESAVIGKTFFAYTFNNKVSRPINTSLYNNANAIAETSSAGKASTKVDLFFNNLLNATIEKQSAIDITEAIYRIVMSFACCTDLFSNSGRKQVGTYFEKFVGHLYATHLKIEPQKMLSTLPLDDNAESIPTDYIFNTGKNLPKYHIPAKFSSRDRAVQVWAQQRLIDGAYGVSRFHCLLTCCNETDYNKKKVKEVCVAGQWLNYQLYIAQILIAYYLDLPNSYATLSSSYPPIHVKIFGEFFHESSALI